MSAINERGISHIKDEDLLKKMWQETEDFGQKKEIRAHMYKLREERLKDLYCSSDVKDVHLITNKKTSFNQSMHADALADHSFASLKRKEIRDSESPTKEVSYRMKGPSSNEGWNISKIEEHSQDGKNHRFLQNAHTSGTEYIPKGKLDFEAKNSHEVTSHQDGDQNNFVKSQGTSSNSFIRQEAVGGDENSSFKTSSTQSSSSSRKVTEQRSTQGDAIDYPRTQLVIEGVNNGDHNSFRKSSTCNNSSSKTFTGNQLTGDDAVNSSRKQIVIESVGRDDQNNFRTSSTNATSSSKTVTEQKSYDDHSRKAIQISDDNVVGKTTKVYTTDAPRELKSHPGYVEGRTKITRETKTLSDGTVVTTTKYETSGANEVKSSSNQYSTSSSTFQDNKSNVITSKSHDDKFSTHKITEGRDNAPSGKHQPKSRYYVEKTHTIPDNTESVHHNVHSRRESNVSEKKVDNTTQNYKSHVDQRYEIRSMDDTTQNMKNSDNVRTVQHFELDDRRKDNIDIQKKENVRKEVVENSKVQQKTVATHDVNSVPLGTPIEIEINLTRINDNQERRFKTQGTPVSHEPHDDKPRAQKSPNIYDTPQRREPAKHESELKSKTKITEGQYDTTYKTDYTNKKISVEVSPTHDAFARSLRAVSPDRLSSRTSSRNLKNSNSSLRSSSSPEKSYLDRRHPQRMSPDRQTNGRYHSPTKKTPEKFSSTETITYRTTSRPSSQRVSPDKNQKTKNSNEIKLTSTITKKTDDRTTYRTPQSPPKNVPIPKGTEQYTNSYEITTDLDDNVSTFSHSTITKNRTDRVHSNVDSKTINEFSLTNQKKPGNEGNSTKEPLKRDKPADKPLKRTDTYEERCRQILGITSDTNEKRRSSLEKLRKRGSTVSSQVESIPKTSPETPRQKSPTKQGTPIQEFPAQIRRSPEKYTPEKKESSPTKDRKTSVERKRIQEYPSQNRRSPEKPEENASPTRSSPRRPVGNSQERKPSSERTPIREFPSQTRPEDQEVSTKTILKSMNADKQEKRPSTQRKPSSERTPIGEFPSQTRPEDQEVSTKTILKSTNADKQERRPSTQSKPSSERTPIGEFPSQTRPEDQEVSTKTILKSTSVDKQERRASTQSKPSSERTPIREFPSQTRPEDQEVSTRTILKSTNADEQERRPSTQSEPIGEYPSQKRPSPEKQSPNRSSSRRTTDRREETSICEVTNDEETNSTTNITNVSRKVTEIRKPSLGKDGPKKTINKKPNEDTSSEEDNIEVSEVEVTQEFIYDIPRNSLLKNTTNETQKKTDTSIFRTDKSTERNEVNVKKTTSDYVSEDEQITKSQVETIHDIDVNERKTPVYRTTEVTLGTSTTHQAPKKTKPEGTTSTRNIPSQDSPTCKKSHPQDDVTPKTPKKLQPNERDQSKPKTYDLFDVETVEQTEDIMSENEQTTTEESVRKLKTVGELVKSFTSKDTGKPREPVGNIRKPTDKTPSSSSPSRKPSTTQKSVNEIKISETTKDTSSSVKVTPIDNLREPTTKDGPKLQQSNQPRQERLNGDYNKIEIEVEEIITIESDEEIDEPKQKTPINGYTSQEFTKNIKRKEDNISEQKLIEIDFSTNEKISNEVSRGPTEKTPSKKPTLPQRHVKPTKPCDDSVTEVRRNDSKTTEQKDIQYSSVKTKTFPKDKPSQRSPSSSSLPRKPVNSTVTKSSEVKHTKTDSVKTKSKPSKEIPSKTNTTQKPISRKPIENFDNKKKPSRGIPCEPHSDYSSEAEEEIHTKKHVMETYEGRTPVEEPLVMKKTMSLLYSDDEDDQKTTQLLIESEITERQPITSQKKNKPVESPKTTTSKLITSEKHQTITQRSKSPLKTAPLNKIGKKPTVEKKPETTKPTQSNRRELPRKENKQNTLKDIEIFENITEDKTIHMRSNRVDDTVNKKKTTVMTTEGNKPINKYPKGTTAQKTINGIAPKRPSSRNTITVEKTVAKTQKTTKPTLHQKNTVSSSKTKTESRTEKVKTKTTETIKSKPIPKKITKPEDSDEESLPDSLNESMYSSLNEITSNIRKNETQSSTTEEIETRRTSSVRTQPKDSGEKPKVAKPITEKKFIPTKSVINSNNRGTVDLQRSISSREATPDRMCPLPVTSDEEGFAPRYPDKVVEPDEGSPRRRYDKLFETSINEYGDSIHSKKIVEINEDVTQRVSEIDRVDNDDDSLLTVDRKINKFLTTAEKLTEKPIVDISQPAPKVERPKFVVNDDLKEDDCLLSVSDKVQKFITEAEHLTTQKDTQHRKSVNIETTSDVSNRINQFTSPQQPESHSSSPRKLSTPKNVLPSGNDTSKKEPKHPERREPIFLATLGRTKLDQDVFITTERAEIEKDQELCRTSKRPSQPSVHPEHASPKSTDESKSKTTYSNTKEKTSTVRRTSTVRTEMSDDDFESVDLNQVVEDSSNARKNSLKEFTPKNRRPSQEDKVILSSVGRLRSNESIKKAKALFENTESVNREEKRQKDILNRPSVFEGRNKTVKETNLKKSIDRNSVTPKRLVFSSEKETKDDQQKITRSNEKESTEKNVPGYMKPLDRKSIPEQDHSKRKYPQDEGPESQIPGYMRPIDRSHQHSHNENIEIREHQEHRSIHEDDHPGYMEPLDRSARPQFDHIEKSEKHLTREHQKHRSIHENDHPGYMEPLDRSARPQFDHTENSETSERHLTREHQKHRSIHENDHPGYMEPLDRSARPQFDHTENSETSERHLTREHQKHRSIHENDHPGYMEPLDRSARPQFDHIEKFESADSHLTREHQKHKSIHEDDHPGYMRPIDRSHHHSHNENIQTREHQKHRSIHENDHPGYMEPLDRSARPQFDHTEKCETSEKYLTREHQKHRSIHENDHPGYMEPLDRSARPQFDHLEKFETSDRHQKHRSIHENDHPGYMEPLDRSARPQFDHLEKSETSDRHQKHRIIYENDHPGYMEPLDRSARPQFDHIEKSSESHLTREHQKHRSIHENDHPGYMEPLDRSARPQFDHIEKFESSDSHLTREHQKHKSIHEDDHPGYMRPIDRSHHHSHNENIQTREHQKHRSIHENDHPGYMQPLDRSSRPQFDRRDRSESPVSHTSSGWYPKPDADKPGNIYETPGSRVPGYMKPLDRSHQHSHRDTSDSPEPQEHRSTPRHSIPEDDNRRHYSPSNHSDRDNTPSYMKPLDRSGRPEFDRRERSQSPKKGVPVHNKPKEPAGTPTKFGVTLKRTDSGKTVTTSLATATEKKHHILTKKNITEEEIEEVYDLDVLEELLLKFTIYELRRKIRTQIRIVKKLISENKLEITIQNLKNKIKTTDHSQQTKETTRKTNDDDRNIRRTTPTRKIQESNKHEITEYRVESSRKESVSSTVVSESIGSRRSKSPEKKTSNRKTPERTTPERSSPERRFSTKSISEKNTVEERTTSHQSTFRTKGKDRPEEPSVSPKTTSSNTFKSSLKKTEPKSKTPTTASQPEWITQRNLKKTGTNEVVKKSSVSSSSSTVKKQNTRSSSTQKTEATDLIQSSYGIGPTDENGAPLFGLRALRAQNTNGTTKVQGTVVSSQYYSETGKEPVGQISFTEYSSDPRDLGVDQNSTRNGDIMSITTTQKYGYDDAPSLKQLTSTKKEICDSQTNKRKNNTKSSTITRKNSVKALTQKFVENAVEVSKNERQSSYPKAGLILRSSSFKNESANDDDYSEHSAEERIEQSVSMKSMNSSNSKTVSSGTFLRNKSKVTGVQDAITRMKAKDVEYGDTQEDIEAKDLLNKYLGSQVILSGIEGQVSRTGTSSSKAASFSTSAKSTSRVTTVTMENGKEVTRTLTFEHPVSDEVLDNVWDEQTLRYLLDQSTDYEERKRIRARLRIIMAEQEACTELVKQASQDQSSQSIDEKSMETSKEIVREGPVTTTKVTKVSTQQHISKKPMSPFAKFRQLDKQNSLNTPPSTPRTPGGSPLFKFTDAALSQSASTIKDRLLYWCRMKTKEYENIQLDNFSSSWADGLAFCALVHHFLPDAFDYHALTPKERRHNFTLAFKVADEKADIAPLLDVDDMVETMRPDWKCVFTYVQSIYRRFKDED